MIFMSGRLAVELGSRGLRLTARSFRSCYSSYSSQVPLAGETAAVTNRQIFARRRCVVVRHRSRDRVALAPPGERQSSQQTTGLRLDEDSEFVEHDTSIYYVKQWQLAYSSTGCHGGRRRSRRATRSRAKSRDSARPAAVARRCSHQPSVNCLTLTGLLLQDRMDRSFLAARQ